ncbi:MAG TPA: alanine dehydrogenase [Burkholderiales bacterium]|nr:alanine dehydrogenase [Burkholderiales bacterium]
MRIGIPREIKDGEFRVALTPAAVRQLENVVVEPGAGAGVGFTDAQYLEAGAKLGNAWDCELIVKVKELQPEEYERPRRGQTICGFQQFTAEPELLDAAIASGATFVVYHTVGQASGRYPVLAPMSAIAGRLAVQVGAWCLQRQNGGSGVLLPGVDGVPPGKVVILGAGTVGANALAVARGLGTRITVFARSARRFDALRKRFPEARYVTALNVKTLTDADLIIGAVFLPGQRSPKLLSRSMLAAMRPGSALVDVGIDQGGIAETSRQTTHSDPIYIEEGVVHYCVPNLPAACARTASLALEQAVLPYVKILANGQMDDDLKTGIQVAAGKVVHPELAQSTRR